MIDFRCIKNNNCDNAIADSVLSTRSVNYWKHGLADMTKTIKYWSLHTKLHLFSFVKIPVREKSRNNISKFLF